MGRETGRFFTRSTLRMETTCGRTISVLQAPLGETQHFVPHATLVETQSILLNLEAHNPTLVGKKCVMKQRRKHDKGSLRRSNVEELRKDLSLFATISHKKR